MNSQGPFFLFKISYILALKKSCLVFLTTFLKFFQFSKCLEFLYIFKYLWQFLFYHDFKYLVILTIFACLYQVLSVLFANSYIMHSRFFLLLMWLVSSFFINPITSVTKLISSLLFLMIVCFLVWIFFAKIEIFTARETWYDDNL